MYQLSYLVVKQGDFKEIERAGRGEGLKLPRILVFKVLQQG